MRKRLVEEKLRLMAGNREIAGDATRYLPTENEVSRWKHSLGQYLHIDKDVTSSSYADK